MHEGVPILIAMAPAYDFSHPILLWSTERIVTNQSCHDATSL
jgi:hypothetical protein